MYHNHKSSNAFLNRSAVSRVSHQQANYSVQAAPVTSAELSNKLHRRVAAGRFSVLVQRVLDSCFDSTCDHAFHVLCTAMHIHIPMHQ